MKTTLCVGCSHSYTYYGKAWPDFLCERIGSKLIRASTPGAGNAAFIEKLHTALKENTIDNVIVQLTEPSRIVVGIRRFEYDENNLGYDNPNTFNDIGYYSFNAYKNDENLERILGKKYEIDNFWTSQVSVSNWVNYRVMHDVITMQYLCDHYKVPVIFWSWFLPFDQLFIDPYTWLKDKINYVPGCAFDFLMNNKIPRVSDEDHHYPPDSQQILVDQWLLKEILKFRDIL